MKQCSKNPWQVFSESHQVGDVVEGVVKNFTEFGLFVGFESGDEVTYRYSFLLTCSTSPPL